MNIPKAVCTGTFTWFIKKVKALFMSDGEQAGITDRDRLTISISTNTAKQNLEETFVHELLHAMFYEAGLRLDDELEHKIIYALSPVILRTFRDNNIF